MGRSTKTVTGGFFNARGCTTAHHAVGHSPEEALRHVVDALGGLQRVGHALRPETDPILAGQWLSHCLTREAMQASEELMARMRAAGLKVDG